MNDGRRRVSRAAPPGGVRRPGPRADGPGVLSKEIEARLAALEPVAPARALEMAVLWYCGPPPKGAARYTARHGQP